MAVLPPILASLAALCIVFACGRIAAGKLNNYGLVDVLWCYGFLVVAGLCALLEPGWPARRGLVAGLVAIWSLRLGTHILRRVIRTHPEEDSRYRQLRQDWADGFEGRMTWFFQAQAVSVVVLAIPFFAACLNPRPGFGPAEVAGIVLWLAGLFGEGLADSQLAAFKADPARRGQVCQAGLWRFSRHPNYFFEWTVWLGYFVLACGSPGGWIAAVCPAAILWLLLRVTGIPLAEQQSLRSKGEAYRRYQRTTSAFVPWFPRHA